MSRRACCAAAARGLPFMCRPLTAARLTWLHGSTEQLLREAQERNDRLERQVDFTREAMNRQVTPGPLGVAAACTTSRATQLSECSCSPSIGLTSQAKDMAAQALRLVHAESECGQLMRHLAAAALLPGYRGPAPEDVSPAHASSGRGVAQASPGSPSGDVPAVSSSPRGASEDGLKQELRRAQQRLEEAASQLAASELSARRVAQEATAREAEVRHAHHPLTTVVADRSPVHVWLGHLLYGPRACRASSPPPNRPRRCVSAWRSWMGRCGVSASGATWPQRPPAGRWNWRRHWRAGRPSAPTSGSDCRCGVARLTGLAMAAQGLACHQHSNWLAGLCCLAPSGGRGPR